MSSRSVQTRDYKKSSLVRSSSRSFVARTSTYCVYLHDREIIIGRIKLPTVNGAEHGFLLKRFDTNAIAGSSMFRLAFPYADAEEESVEMTYLESRFDTEAANGGFVAASRSSSPRKTDTPSKKTGTMPPGSTGVRLQGVWIPCQHASSIANDYGILELAQPLIEATALLLPNSNTPILNPDAATVASAAHALEKSEEAENESTEEVHSEDTNSRLTKRVRTAEVPSAPTKTEESSTPSQRTTRRSALSSSAALSRSELSNSLTPAQIDAQIRESQLLAAKVQDEAMQDSNIRSRANKRRAEDDHDGENVKVASQESSGRRRRPLARAAGMLTAAGAMGIGAMAWYTGSINFTANMPQVVQQLQNVDYASALHTIQQNIHNWGISSWFG